MLQTSPLRFTLGAVAFEAALGVLAIGLGRLFGYSPLETVGPLAPLSGQLVPPVLWGVAAAMPMVVAILYGDRWPRSSVARLKRFVERRLVPFFVGLSVWQLGLISLAAGVGEELLFRGLLQAGLTAWIGPPAGLAVGLVVASLLFGISHALTPTYAVLATLVGFYFGALLLVTDNLIAPITAHALYDFVALVYLVKFRRPRAAGGG